MTATALRITTNGIIHTIDLETRDGSITFEALSQAVARFIEPVAALLDGHQLSFWFDEEGFYTQPGNYNHAATALLAALGVNNQAIYVGDCVVTCFDPETGSELGLDSDLVALLMSKAAAAV